MSGDFDKLISTWTPGVRKAPGSTCLLKVQLFKKAIILLCQRINEHMGIWCYVSIYTELPSFYVHIINILILGLH